ncbi:MAG: hypothetical protein OEV44_12590 [Spirochaetota bacterium]|nr:hypothetical protein [Spirochaetota bacterium]
MSKMNIRNLDKYIAEYYRRLESFKKVGAETESTTENAMKMLLMQVSENNNLVLNKVSAKRRSKI